MSESAAPTDPAELEQAIRRGAQALGAVQKEDGHFVFELEADATIPAEYVLLTHYLAETPDLELERKVGNYLRRIQGAHGGWPLFHAGKFNVSASVKAYFALKMIGDDVAAPHMVRARQAILAAGGAETSNVFTRFLLSLFGEVPWSSVPSMPVELMLMPRWFPVTIWKVSYWARTVVVPMLVIQSLGGRARNPRGVRIQELFVTPPHLVRRWPGSPFARQPWEAIFNGIDATLKRVERFFPKASRKKAIGKAVAFVTERLNGVDGLGAIFPAMANSVMMYDLLGYPESHPDRATARASLDKLLVFGKDEIYCQPCVSPVWDTALAAHALAEAGGGEAEARAQRGLAWLKDRQVLDVVGDWAAARPNVRPGGWAFQYNNAHYPDLDDTAVVVMAMDRARHGFAPQGPAFDEPIKRAVEWVKGLQSRGGGWAAFDADNTKDYLNNIPFADHGALLDPPTADVTARCIGMLAQLGETAQTSPHLRDAVAWLDAEQEADGSWFGRWGMNYIYGTWSVLNAYNAIGRDATHPAVARACGWLASIQNPDGGWGEDGESYEAGYKGYEAAPSTPSQTAWALLGLMAGGGIDHPAVARGIAYLAARQGEDGLWPEELFTATGFPRVFYLRYHGYPKFFPLWAMARYRNLKGSNRLTTAYGM